MKLQNIAKYSVVRWHRVVAFSAAYVALFVLSPSHATADRIHAIQYSNDYAEIPNPCFHAYGSDCTNYVSQCIWAGGVDMTYNLIEPWFFFSEHIVSNSWTFTDALYDYLIGEGLAKDLGDVKGKVYVDSMGKKSYYDHATVGDFFLYEFPVEPGTEPTPWEWDHAAFKVAYHERWKSDVCASRLLRRPQDLPCWSGATTRRWRRSPSGTSS